MNSAETPSTLSLDELQSQVVNYSNNFEDFQKNREALESQKGQKLLDEETQREMELELETKQSELATNRATILTSIDTALLKKDIDAQQKIQIEKSKQEITQKDPNTSGDWREKLKKFVSRNDGRWKHMVWGWLALLAIFWIKSRFSQDKKEEKPSDDSQDTPADDQEGDTQEWEDNKEAEWGGDQDKNPWDQSTPEEDNDQESDKTPIDALDEQVGEAAAKVEKVEETAEKAEKAVEKIKWRWERLSERWTK